MNSVAVERGEGALSGETKLSEFAAQHSVALTRFAYLLCGDHQLAEDLVQDAFVALYRRFGETMTIAAPVAYARRVIVNGQISRACKRSSRETITDEVPETSSLQAIRASRTRCGRPWLCYRTGSARFS